jgi:hypothetical protein
MPPEESRGLAPMCHSSLAGSLIRVCNCDFIRSHPKRLLEVLLICLKVKSRSTVDEKLASLSVMMICARRIAIRWMDECQRRCKHATKAYQLSSSGMTIFSTAWYCVRSALIRSDSLRSHWLGHILAQHACIYYIIPLHLVHSQTVVVVGCSVAHHDSRL